MSLNPATWVSSAIDGVFGIGKDLIEIRKATREAELRLKIAKFESKARIEEAKSEAVINMAGKAQDHVHEWERIMAQNSGASWKDEFILLLFSIPLVMSFIPGLAPFVSLGFEELDAAPDWYLQVVMAGVAVAYGLRSLVKVPIVRRQLS